MLKSGARTLYRRGLVTIERCFNGRKPVLGLHLHSAAIALKQSQQSRPEYRAIKGHIIGAPSIVAANPGIAQTELASMLACGRATAGLHVAHCIELGWIKRTRSTRDRRRYELRITAKGARMLEDVRSIIEKQESEFLLPLSRWERHMLRDLLTKLISS